MLNDPEHPQISILVKLRTCFKSVYNFHSNFKIPLISYGVMLLIMIIDKKRKEHRSLYLLGTIAVVIFCYVLIFSALTTAYYNAIMFPLFFIGLTSYILINDKPKTLFASLYLFGFLYSLAAAVASNQYYYIIFTALSVSNVASYIFLGILIKEMRETEDNLEYALLLIISSLFSINNSRTLL